MKSPAPFGDAQPKGRRIGVIGTYVPQRCGIATFGSDLLNSLANAAPGTDFVSVALKDRREGYDYPAEVQFEITKGNLADYRSAVDFLNINDFDAVSVQHEFGIYGGSTGSYVLRLLQTLRIPVVTTLHTILDEPTAEQKQVISMVADLSDRLVVMSDGARRSLQTTYDIPKSRIAVIPHGVPDVPFLDTSYHKDRFGLIGRTVILTFGLLSRGKGLEHMIRALPEVVAKHPQATYVIVGQTHPQVLREEGEAYRDMLEATAKECGVEDNVRFVNSFMNTRALLEILSTADVFVTPYLGREQIVSGVLSYAMGAGKAVVSTPYRYAEELLADGRGSLVPFADSAALAGEVSRLLSDDIARQAMRKKAYTYSRGMVWRNVAHQYLDVIESVRCQRASRPRLYRDRSQVLASPGLPDVSFEHLGVLTDDTGILQHARFTIPDRDHGYCTDDNARALIVALLGRQVDPKPDWRGLSVRYLGFLQHAMDETSGRFRNFMSYDRRWLEAVGSEDAHGRALWGLGYAIGNSKHLVAPAVRLFEQALPAMEGIAALRAQAFALIGIEAFLSRFQGATEVRRAQLRLAENLLNVWRENASDDWPWPEDRLTYANAVLCQALIAAGAQLGRDDMAETGLRALRWLADVQTDDKGHFVPIGNDGWMTRTGHRARFDQQPLEAQHMVDAALEARRLTGEDRWLGEARRCFEWFLGRNDLQQPLCDPATGGCGDGLGAEGVNRNQGAESTLAFLHALLRLQLVLSESAPVRPPTEEEIRLAAAPQGQRGRTETNLRVEA